MRNFIGCLLFVCLATTVFAQRYIPNDSIIVLYSNQELPVGAVKLGSIKNKPNDFGAKCDYNSAIDEARNSTRDMGGNVLRFKKLSVSDGVGCYKFKADVFKADIREQLKEIAHKNDSITHSLLSDTAKYALLYVYRTEGASGGFNLTTDDGKLLWKSLHSTSKKIIKLDKQGPIRFYVKATDEDEQLIYIRPGHVYFMRCGINTRSFTAGGVIGALVVPTVVAPTIDPVSPQIGIMEFNDIDNLE